MERAMLKIRTSQACQQVRLGTGIMDQDTNAEGTFIQVLVEKQAATQQKNSGVQNCCCLSSDVLMNRSQDH